LSMFPMIGAPSEIKAELNLAGKAMNTHARIVPLESSRLP